LIRLMDNKMENPTASIVSVPVAEKVLS